MIKFLKEYRIPHKLILHISNLTITIENTWILFFILENKNFSQTDTVQQTVSQLPTKPFIRIIEHLAPDSVRVRYESVRISTGPG